MSDDNVMTSSTARDYSTACRVVLNCEFEWTLWDYVRTPLGPLNWGYAASEVG